MAKNDDFIKTALERFKQASDFESENRDRAIDDMRFMAMEQWPEELRRAREDDPDGARPCLVVDKVSQYIRQVQNEMRQQRPAPKMRPVDSVADLDVAEVLQGVTRNIMDNSSADIAIDTAFEHATEIGFGYFRIITDYEDEMSFNQEIQVKRVRNPFTVYLDPNHQEPDGSDARWGFVVEEIPEEEFEQSYPNAQKVSFETAGNGDLYMGWQNEDNIRIAEYFYIEDEEVEIVLLSNGMAIPAKDLEEFADQLPPGLTVIKERKTQVPKVKWCKMNCIEVLEEKEWAGKYIPIIPVYGEEMEVDGEVIRTGMVYPAKDAQRAYNYAASAFIERVSLAPKAPYIAANGQIENNRQEWESANTSNIPVLGYDPVDVNGTPVPPPQRQIAADVPQGWLGVMQTSEHDIQSAIGMYNTAVGEQSNEHSGRAIRAKQVKSDVANMHYADNLGRSIRHLGRIIIDLIPKIYDTKRVIRILGPDEEPETVQFNPYQQNPVEEVKDPQTAAVQKIYNPTIGKYDVAVTVGVSYATKRQEAAESMLAITQAYPQLMQLAGDMMVKNMDWPGSDELADRLKRTIPPQILGEGDDQLPPQVEQLMNQASQTIEQQQQQISMLSSALQDKQAEQANKDVETIIKGKDSETRAYEAETKRAKEVMPAMTPEQIQAMIVETVQGLSTAPDISPKEIQEPLDFSGIN
jgi:hypothetical protein